MSRWFKGRVSKIVALNVLVLTLGSFASVHAQSTEQCQTPEGKSLTTTYGFRTVAEIKIPRGHAGLPGIQELEWGCTPAAFARGLWYLIALNDPDHTVDIETIHTGLQEALGFIPATKETKKNETAGTPGPNRVYPWAKLKDKYALELGYKIKTSRLKATPNADFFSDLIGLINAGHAVEVRTKMHASFISRVVRYFQEGDSPGVPTGDYGFFMADDKSPGDTTPATQLRGPFRFDKDGKCVSANCIEILDVFVEKYIEKISQD